MTVTVELQGGLGNQLFQYATGRALAALKNAPLQLDTRNYKYDKLRGFELGVYELPVKINNGTSWPRLLRHLQPRPHPVYCERHFHYDDNIFEQSPPVYLRGYWQSERYFKRHADVLRKEFTPRYKLEGENASIAEKINTCVSVSLHVRRGDYASNPQTLAYHGLCGLDYYERALHYLSTLLPDFHIFVFSDDETWVRQNLRSKASLTFISHNQSENSYLDLELMRRCKHHIIANSSFSWWGAWLNSSVDKIVTAPKQWFANSPHDTCDLLPADWVKM